MISDYFSLAFKNLRHRGLRSWLTILGIFIGIAAVVALISMGAGLKAAVLGQFGALSFDTLTIQNKGVGFGPPGSTVIEKLNENDIEILENVRGVERVIPRLVRVGSLEYNEVKGFGYATDIPEAQENIDFVYDNLALKIDEGKLLQEGDRGKVVLGSSFKTMDDFGKDFRIGKKLKINDVSFEIGGFLKQSSSFQMNSVVFMASEDLQDLMDIDDEWDMIIVRVEDKDSLGDVAGEIERKLRNDRKEDLGEETFSVQTPLQSLNSVNTILNIINLIVVGIAMISLFVGGVGIANTMYTSVVERKREIGIMKAVGARNFDVMMVFLIESGLLGLVGGIVGAAIGLGAAIGASSLANTALGTDLFIISIDYMLLASAVGFSFVVGVVSGVLPALQASKLNVVDAVRG